MAGCENDIQLVQMQHMQSIVLRFRHGGTRISATLMAVLYHDAHLGATVLRVEIHDVKHAHYLLCGILYDETHLTVGINVGTLVLLTLHRSGEFSIW